MEVRLLTFSQLIDCYNTRILLNVSHTALELELKTLRQYGMCLFAICIS